MSFRQRACIAGLFALCLLAPALHAQETDGTGFAPSDTESWFYVGLAGGRVEYQQDEHYYAPFRRYPLGDGTFVDLVAADGIEMRQSQRTHRVFAGYRANRYLALELGYVDDLGESTQATYCLGNLAAADPVFCIPESDGVSQSTARRADLTAVAILPIGRRFEVLGKLGVARTVHKTPWYMGYVHTDVEYFTGGIYGVGTRVLVTPHWALRADFDRSEIPAMEINHHPAKKRINSVWLGIEYAFR